MPDESAASNASVHPGFLCSIGRFLQGRTLSRPALEIVIGGADLSPELAELIHDVVRLAGLRRQESITVAADLAARFEDESKAGKSTAAMLEEFGDPADRAASIRRDVVRGRSLSSRILRPAIRAGLVVLLLFGGFYVVLAVRHWNSKVNVGVDYVAMMNAPTGNSPVEDRAWPEIRAAMSTLNELSSSVDDGTGRTLAEIQKQGRPVSTPGWETTIGEAEDPLESEETLDSEMVDAFFRDAGPALERLRQGVARPILGFPLQGYGRLEEADEDFFGTTWDPAAAAAMTGRDRLLSGSVWHLEFPYLGTLREAARLLVTDAARAAVAGDGDRLVADVEAIFDLGRLVRGRSILITQLVGVAIDQLGFTIVLDVVAATPDTIDTATLDRLDAVLAGLDQTRLGFRLDEERFFFLDLAQRLYTDDGHGGGHLKIEANRGLQELGAGDLLMPGSTSNPLGFLLGPALAAMTVDRQETERIWNDHFDALEGSNWIEPWELDPRARSVVAGFPADEILNSNLMQIRYFPLTLVIPKLDHLMGWPAGIRLERDLVRTVIAAERIRRLDGRWPEDLRDVAIPGRDPFDGGSLRYLLDDGRPFLYLLGPDRDDDGGTWGTGDGRIPARGFADSRRYWGKVPLDDGAGIEGDLPVWAGGTDRRP